jgi:hypothetical protein
LPNPGLFSPIAVSRGVPSGGSSRLGRQGRERCNRLPGGGGGPLGLAASRAGHCRRAARAWVQRLARRARGVGGWARNRSAETQMAWARAEASHAGPPPQPAARGAGGRGGWSAESWAAMGPSLRAPKARDDVAAARLLTTSAVGRAAGGSKQRNLGTEGVNGGCPGGGGRCGAVEEGGVAEAGGAKRIGARAPGEGAALRAARAADEAKGAAAAFQRAEVQTERFIGSRHLLRRRAAAAPRERLCRGGGRAAAHPPEGHPGAQHSAPDPQGSTARPGSSSRPRAAPLHRGPEGARRGGAWRGAARHVGPSGGWRRQAQRVHGNGLKGAAAWSCALWQSGRCRTGAATHRVELKQQIWGAWAQRPGRQGWEGTVGGSGVPRYRGRRGLGHAASRSPAAGGGARRLPRARALLLAAACAGGSRRAAPPPAAAGAVHRGGPRQAGGSSSHSARAPRRHGLRRAAIHLAAPRTAPA